VQPSFKLGRLTRVARVCRVDVYVHWAVFAIAAVMLLGTLRNPLATVIGLAAYLSVLIIHECGHLIMARRLGYDALSMELYPLVEYARFEKPDSRFHRGASRLGRGGGAGHRWRSDHTVRRDFGLHSV